MSHSYSIICIDCGVVLELGKIVNLNVENQSVPWCFAGWLDQVTSKRIENIELLKLLEKFLIIHRGHGLLVASESYLLHKIDPEGKLRYIDSVKEITDKEIIPEPDDFIDRDGVKEYLSNRILKLIE